MNEKAVVLIVDDMVANVHILSSILESEYEIKTAFSGSDALKLVKQEPIPDLILLDVDMPHMNGYAVLHELERSASTTTPPVVFITGKDTQEEEERGLLLGAVDYIKKPLHPAIVKARVQTHINLKQKRDTLSYSASHDQLTNLYNRYHLEEEGRRKFSRAKRTGDNLSVILLDIDHFKLVNDTYGHLVGDEVLKKVALVLDSNKREEDFCARFGGEEFVMVLEGCSSEFAIIKAESLRKKMEMLNPNNISISSSFGVCEIKKDCESFEALLKNADIALYKAKNSGRNKVIEFKGNI